MIALYYCDIVLLQGSADSNFSHHSSELSLDEDKEAVRRETERHALAQLEKARVRCHRHIDMYHMCACN